MIEQREATKLIRDATGLLGRRVVTDLLSPLLTLWAGIHDTGCQPRIAAVAKGYPSITVWCGSVWYSSCYEFNDRGRVLGVQPDCEWAVEKLDAFFTTLSELVCAAKVQRTMNRIMQDESVERQRREAIAQYRSML